MSLLTEQQTANLLSVSTRTLQNWRQFGKGPKHVKVGRGIRYDEAALQEWLAGRIAENTRQGAYLMRHGALPPVAKQSKTGAR